MYISSDHGNNVEALADMDGVKEIHLDKKGPGKQFYVVYMCIYIPGREITTLGTAWEHFCLVL